MFILYSVYRTLMLEILIYWLCRKVRFNNTCLKSATSSESRSVMRDSTRTSMEIDVGCWIQLTKTIRVVQAPHFAPT